MYKFDGYYIELNQMSTSIERSTYNALDWLGDIGGLVDSLLLIGSIVITPIATLAVREQLLS